MIPFNEALLTVLENARLLPVESVPLSQALHRVLAQDLLADRDMPPFDKSAMDGYACRRDDLAYSLDIIETIAAGAAPTRSIGEKECARIMTGAPVPPGADCVIMVEHTETLGENQVRFTGGGTQDNICRQGEDLQNGHLVLRRGERLTPPHIAVLAGVGCVQPAVFQRPRAGIFSTGNELVKCAGAPSDSQIRDTNRPQLAAQIVEAGALCTDYGIVPDDPKAIQAALEKAAAENDLVLLSGGVSMGIYDFVPGAMKNAGFHILFDAIAMKPGKPTTFAVSPSVVCFGLPGNPVSTFVQFALLVKPFLFRCMGHAHEPCEITLPLAAPIRQKSADRMSWIPARITENSEAAPCDYHGSAHIHALCAADALIQLPPGVVSYEKGVPVRVRLL